MQHVSFLQFQNVSEGAFGTFSVLFGTRFVLHCHAVLLFGKVSFFPWRQELEAVAETHAMQKLLFCSFRQEVRHFFGVVWDPFCPSLPCCFAVREGAFLARRDQCEGAFFTAICRPRLMQGAARQGL